MAGSSSFLVFILVILVLSNMVLKSDARGGGHGRMMDMVVALPPCPHIPWIPLPPMPSVHHLPPLPRIPCLPPASPRVKSFCIWINIIAPSDFMFASEQIEIFFLARILSSQKSTSWKVSSQEGSSSDRPVPSQSTTAELPRPSHRTPAASLSPINTNIFHYSILIRITSIYNMASITNYFFSMFILIVLLFSQNEICHAARNLMEIPEKETPPHMPTPTLPEPTLPPKPEIPALPKPTLPPLPKVELPPLPKVELPPLPTMPKVTFPTIPSIPEIPEMPKIPTFHFPSPPTSP
ncbi:uncharacterized protein [Typha angustifolia]|uniref:uncharacterized protein n=1 Tax=Typha angustifolia TaxID=59011 RepID=UPI003C2D5900